ncbi:putative ubiquitin-protein ligase 1 [Monocercomonoides exilis]|uniref:putative ubiquitin-protein ligase 1 n=1 Tax=Monocercomonoides exilis TaxID=2049356 RepID=UPI0035595F88|nr:putative ubiquitin-protein ligase 1 [Monocercomonoides exilis]|eukprot:MONOS_1620.1-p1 / transcript=MONOS_1620.1 / gene=MONOS_1620 / organism=Monocercomonoides_exilis_PA203 / gene_product=ubiquitin-protein ligase 1 / transcript_product=ubiquitin-protein ligase 1 / location=Mono_scaffold00029:148524-151298(+) / protein_length=924 / sequence_SO=supercontig / SO=protein_coding / is_pseudo=false
MSEIHFAKDNQQFRIENKLHDSPESLIQKDIPQQRNLRVVPSSQLNEQQRNAVESVNYIWADNNENEQSSSQRPSSTQQNVSVWQQLRRLEQQQSTSALQSTGQQVPIQNRFMNAFRFGQINKAKSTSLTPQTAQTSNKTLSVGAQQQTDHLQNFEKACLHQDSETTPSTTSSSNETTSSFFKPIYGSQAFGSSSSSVQFVPSSQSNSIKPDCGFSSQMENSSNPFAALSSSNCSFTPSPSSSNPFAPPSSSSNCFAPQPSSCNPFSAQPQSSSNPFAQPPSSNCCFAPQTSSSNPFSAQPLTGNPFSIQAPLELHNEMPHEIYNPFIQAEAQLPLRSVPNSLIQQAAIPSASTAQSSIPGRQSYLEMNRHQWNIQREKKTVLRRAGAKELEVAPTVQRETSAFYSSMQPYLRPAANVEKRSYSSMGVNPFSVCFSGKISQRESGIFNEEEKAFEELEGDNLEDIEGEYDGMDLFGDGAALPQKNFAPVPVELIPGRPYPKSFIEKVDEKQSILTAPPEKKFEDSFAKREEAFRQQLAQHVLNKRNARNNPFAWHDQDVQMLTIHPKRGHYFVQSSLDSFMKSDPNEYYKDIHVVFENEKGVDVGGVRREWFSLIIPAITNPDYGLFATDVTNSNRMSISHLASDAQDDPAYLFRFVGYLMAKALIEQITIPAYFTRFVFKTLLDELPHISDVAGVDPELTLQMAQMEQEDVSEYGIPFSLNVEVFGDVREVELVAGGAEIEVTNENKEDFIALCAHHRLLGNTAKHLKALKDAFHQVIPLNLLKDKFTPEELELMICGSPVIDVNDWMEHTMYTGGFTKESQTVKWFWECIQNMKEVGRQLVLFFATGSRTAPVQGFNSLIGSSWNQKKLFEIRKSETSTSDFLPVAHTCFNQIDMPEYDSKEQLKEKLLLALSSVNEGFTMG